MGRKRHPTFGYFMPTAKSYDYLLEHECVKEWVSGYAANTRKHYLQALQKFSEWLGLNPQQLLELSSDEAKDKVLSFAKSYVSEGKRGAALSVFNGLKSFFGYHNKPLDFNKYRKQFIHRRLKKIDHEVIPDNEMVYRIVDVNRKLLVKAIILVLFQSGLRISAVHNLNYGHVREQLEIGRVPIRLKITENVDTKLRHSGVHYYYTFLGKEAFEVLRNYVEGLKKKEIPLSDDSPLFFSKYRKRLSTSGIYQVVKKAVHRAGYDSSTVWVHCFRKSFRKVLNKSEMDEDTKEALMGHKLPGSRQNYFDVHDVDEIELKYMKCGFGREKHVSPVDLKAYYEERLKKQFDIFKRDMQLFGSILRRIYPPDVLEKAMGEAKAEIMSELEAKKDEE